MQKASSVNNSLVKVLGIRRRPQELQGSDLEAKLKLSASTFQLRQQGDESHLDQNFKQRLSFCVKSVTEIDNSTYMAEIIGVAVVLADPPHRVVSGARVF